LPDEIDLSALTEMICDLWQRSVAQWEEGVVEEWAALLVRDETGALRMMNPVVGTEFAALPDYGLPVGTEFVGTFHTHPRTDGLVPMPFSPTDYVSAIELQESVSLLVSDGLVMALVRTTATAIEVDSVQLELAYAQVAEQTYRRVADRLLAIWSANFAMCKRFGWALYAGPLGGLLRRRWP
jgi:hypothetical protein